MKRIGVYGSLKKGFYNHTRFGLDKCTRLADTTIIGAMDMTPYGYPRLYEIGTYPDLDMEYPMEVYEVGDMLFSTLDQMERGAGYYPQFFIDDDGQEVYYWLMGNRYPINRDKYIKEYVV